MKHLIPCAVLLSIWLLPSSAKASDLYEKMAALKTAIRQEMATKAKPAADSPDYQAYTRATYLAASLDELVPQIIDNSNSGQNADMQLSQILSLYTSDAVQKAGNDLLNEIRQERKQRAAAANEDMQTFLKHVSDEVSKAKKAEDLDGVLAELQKYNMNRSGGYDPGSQALVQQVSQSFEFVKLWQNYLSHMENKQGQLATNDLQSLSQNNYNVSLVPRSEILRLLASAKDLPPGDGNGNGENINSGQNARTVEAEKIISDIKTLDDMEPALRKLDPLRLNNNQAAQNCFNGLDPFVQLYINVKAGLPATINTTSFGSGEGLRLAPGLQAQLLNFVLQHYFDSYKGAPPAVDELPPVYVRRVMDDAIERKDWALLRQALSTQTYLNRSVNLGLYTNNSASAGVDDLLAGLNQEAAGQYALAVVSYESALKIPDTTIPAKLIGEKLAAIQKDHSQEFTQGMQMFTQPPQPQMYNGFPYRPGMSGYPGYPNMPNGMPYRPGMPGGSDSQSPILSIPGTAKPPTPVPAPPPSVSPAPDVKKQIPKGDDHTASPKPADVTSNSDQTKTISQNGDLPGMPFGFFGTTGSGQGEINLNWINHPEKETYMLIQKSLDNVNWETAVTLTDPTINSYTVKGLELNRGYYFQIIAANDL